ncbi:unnamed protein product [Cuscuta europaea]|uniref:Reverse transcriptase Ty1/copia-type domain-containing protein n=1 Tax=Cuscuta europaea TaxID=41803 RepID=A0A9P0YXZ6_CUSEU|nr:unnamed protein product [Cuscuta europaea]
MTGAKESVTPMSSSLPIQLADGSPPTDSTRYRRTLGLLQYLAFTRPDIAFAVNRLSQYMHSPSELHWQAVKRILRYLKGTIHYGLFLHRSTPLHLSAFSDSSWGNICDEGRSTTAYAIYLGSNVISWKSAKQKCVSRSSTEAEYRAVANASAKSFGFVIFFVNWAYLLNPLLHFFVIIKVPHMSVSIQFFTHV